MGKVKLNSGHRTIMRERFKMEDIMAKASLFLKVRPTKDHFKMVYTMAKVNSRLIGENTKTHSRMVFIMGKENSPLITVVIFTKEISKMDNMKDLENLNQIKVFTLDNLKMAKKMGMALTH